MKEQDDEVSFDEVTSPNVEDNEVHADELLANEVPAQTPWWLRGLWWWPSSHVQFTPTSMHLTLYSKILHN